MPKQFAKREQKSEVALLCLDAPTERGGYNKGERVL